MDKWDEEFPQLLPQEVRDDLRAIERGVEVEWASLRDG